MNLANSDNRNNHHYVSIIKTLIVIATAIGLLVVLAGCALSSESSKWFDKAMDYYGSNDQKAIEYLNKSIDADSKNKEAHYYKGNIYYYMGSHAISRGDEETEKEALALSKESLEKAFDLYGLGSDNPNTGFGPRNNMIIGDMLNRLGTLSHDTGDMEKAEYYYKLVLEYCNENSVEAEVARNALNRIKENGKSSLEVQRETYRIKQESEI